MSRDVPGNAIASQAEFDRQMRRAGERLLMWERVCDRMWQEGQYVGNVTIKPKGDGRADYMLIIRMVEEGEHFVAFVTDDTLSGVLSRVVSMLENKSIKWKEDKYARGD